MNIGLGGSGRTTRLDDLGAEEIPATDPDVELPVEPYTAPSGAPTAIIIDVDGTVALMHSRGPFEWGRVSEDRPNWPVITVVNAVIEQGHVPLFCSGRDEVCRDATSRWLMTYLKTGYPAHLAMRPKDDYRPDDQIKLEIFDRDIRHHYHVVAAFDDRNRVVDLWRKLGITCLQVAPGDF